MVAADPALALLPGAGEPVRVEWGRAVVAGRVIETYSGIRPRVVVELEPGEVDDSAITITVPATAVEASDSSTSDWARAYRYEREVAAALARVGDKLAKVQLSPILGQFEVDILVHFEDGQQIVVETKGSWVSGRLLEKVLTRTRDLAHQAGAGWLVVLPGRNANDRHTLENVGYGHVVVWTNEDDDDSLRRAVENARIASSTRPTSKSSTRRTGPG